jgi:glutaredoxin
MKLFFRYFFRTLRVILGPFLLLWELIFSPKGIERTSEDQKQVNNKTKFLTLYQYPTCPFCIKVRRIIKKQSLTIEVRNAQQEGNDRNELISQGGKAQVPCLKIIHAETKQVEWLYESDAIITYLKNI